ELVKELEKTPRDVSTLRILLGDPGSGEALMGIRKRVPRLRFMGGAYGQTECGMMITMCDVEEAVARGNRCAGRPVSLVEVRIFNEDDVELPPGEVGEIVVRGPRVMVGYYNLPEVNAQTFRNGWLHTGDLAKMDKDGYVYYVDRKRELIKTGMENVYPEEVERVLAVHPAVKEVAVIGIPDAQWGEAITAIVALKPGAAATAEELIEFCKQQIASYKKPKFVRFVAELPKDKTGQILRAEVKAKHGYGLVKPA
ncbi:MAG: AMP-binding protein, partial [Chloroflexi bacterium]|nr:AMP-binding protein [Chloroflexota bacterium]